MALLNQMRRRIAQHVDPHDTSAGLFAPPRHVDQLSGCYFYHTIDLPEHGVQEGEWDLRGRFSDYIGQVDVRGKRVLDVGSASGFLSFEAERHGAEEVVSFDLDNAHRQALLPFAGSPYVTDHAAWCERQSQAFGWWHNAYWLTHRLLKSSAKVVYGDVYDPPANLGLFDVVIVGAILEHLADPLTALFSLSRHARDLIVVNTTYFDTPDLVAAFNGRADRPEGDFVFWTYSVALYDEYMRIMGFDPLNHRKDKFAALPPAPGAERPMMDRVALVYRRDPSRNPATDPVAERVRR